MRLLKSLVIAGVLVTGSVSAQAGETACPQHFHNGVAPDFYLESLVTDAAELCYSAFGVMHSGAAAIPLYSAEHLTKEEVFAAKGIDRIDNFRAERRLPARHRADLHHYRGSGYDRGHLAPSKNMPTHQAMDESFTLANMVPQLPDLNRGVWVSIEATARALAVSYDEVYLVTGVSFAESTMLKRLKGRVIVPTSVFKAVYIPSQNAAAAWYASNSGNGGEFEVISIDTLKGRVGFDPFPSVDPRIKSVAAGLPEPSRGYDRQISAMMNPSVDYSMQPGTEPNSAGAIQHGEAELSLLDSLVIMIKRLVSELLPELLRWLKSLI